MHFLSITYSDFLTTFYVRIKDLIKMNISSINSHVTMDRSRVMDVKASTGCA